MHACEWMDLNNLYQNFRFGSNILVSNTDLTTGNWTRGGNLQSNGAVSDPDGGTGAYRFTSLNNFLSFLYQDMTLEAGATYRLSAQVKSPSNSNFFFRYVENKPGLQFTNSPSITLNNTWQTVNWDFTTITPTGNSNQIHVLPADRPNGSIYDIYRPTLRKLI